MLIIKLVLVLLAIVFFGLQFSNTPKYQWGWGALGLLTVAFLLLPLMGAG